MNLRTDYPAIFSALEYARTHPDCKPHEWVLEVKQLIDSHALVDEALDLATAKLATAIACDKCGIPGEGCPHCTNGVVYSDERAWELLSRLNDMEKKVQSYEANTVK